MHREGRIRSKLEVMCDVCFEYPTIICTITHYICGQNQALMMGGGISAAEGKKPFFWHFSFGPDGPEAPVTGESL